MPEKYVIKFNGYDNELSRPEYLAEFKRYKSKSGNTVHIEVYWTIHKVYAKIFNDKKEANEYYQKFVIDRAKRTKLLTITSKSKKQ